MAGEEDERIYLKEAQNKNARTRIPKRENEAGSQDQRKQEGQAPQGKAPTETQERAGARNEQNERGRGQGAQQWPVSKVLLQRRPTLKCSVRGECAWGGNGRPERRLMRGEERSAKGG